MSLSLIKRKHIHTWSTRLLKAVDFDAWGQVVEAMECYERLSGDMTAICTDDYNNMECELLRKVAACLKLRSRDLNDLSDVVESVTLNEMKQLNRVLEDISHGRLEDVKFPVPMSRAKQQVALASPIASSIAVPVNSGGNGDTSNMVVMLTVSDDEEPDDDEEEERGTEDSQEVSDTIAGKKRKIRAIGSLLPLPAIAGRLVSILIDKVGLKDSGGLIEPFISISIRNRRTGECIGVSQDTPFCKNRDNRYLLFKTNVHLQTPIDKLPHHAAIFFELKHFKPKKNKNSTLCFSFMEQDELKNGPVALELYEKPVDYKCKKIRLVTTKPLYFHLKLKIHDE